MNFFRRSPEKIALLWQLDFLHSEESRIFSFATGKQVMNFKQKKPLNKCV